jgi:hypothetical protein
MNPGLNFSEIQVDGMTICSGLTDLSLFQEISKAKPTQTSWLITHFKGLEENFTFSYKEKEKLEKEIPVDQHFNKNEAEYEGFEERKGLRFQYCFPDENTPLIKVIPHFTKVYYFDEKEREKKILQVCVFLQLLLLRWGISDHTTNSSC